MKNVSFESIKRASIESGAHEFIENLPNSYNTIIGERGLKLSVGERQRISNILVIKDNFINEDNKKIINKYDKIRILQVIKNDFFKKLEKNHLYIIDPLGNIFIFYDKDFSAKGLKKDIKKILKVSRIG